jgi:hypothetical protein
MVMLFGVLNSFILLTGISIFFILRIPQVLSTMMSLKTLRTNSQRGQYSGDLSGLGICNNKILMVLNYL